MTGGAGCEEGPPHTQVLSDVASWNKPRETGWKSGFAAGNAVGGALLGVPLASLRRLSLVSWRLRLLLQLWTRSASTATLWARRSVQRVILILDS